MRIASLLLPLIGIASAVPSHTGTGASVIAHDGPSVGKEVVHKNLTYYVTGKKSDKAVLYLTDVFGIQLLENRLLADSFGRAGYRTIAPDLFDGKPAPEDINGTPNFNVTEFLYRHRPEVTDPKIAQAIDFIQTKLGIDTIAVTGYCFGGRYTFRVLNDADSGVTAGFTAHPSLLEDAEIQAITGPVSIAAAETDSMLSPSRRHAIEGLLQETGEAYSIGLYSGTQHGFGVRANVSDPRQKFGKEEAFVQAVRWFDAWA